MTMTSFRCRVGDGQWKPKVVQSSVYAPFQRTWPWSPASNFVKWFHITELVVLSCGGTFESSGELLKTIPATLAPDQLNHSISEWSPSKSIFWNSFIEV